MRHKYVHFSLYWKILRRVRVISKWYPLDRECDNVYNKNTNRKMVMLVIRVKWMFNVVTSPVSPGRPARGVHSRQYAIVTRRMYHTHSYAEHIDD